MCPPPCGPRRRSYSRPKKDKKLVPTKVVLSYDECIRAGRLVIGSWSKDYVPGSSHFRPSFNEGRVYYTASLKNGKNVEAYTKADLRSEIIVACSGGINPEE